MIPVLEWDGQPISRPGIYSNIPMEAYHGQLTVGPSISSSGLRTIFHESPRAYFRTSYLNPRRRIEKTSEAFIFGRAAHHLLLGESDFRQHFIIRPETYPEGMTVEARFWPEVLDVWEGENNKPWSGNATVCKAWLFWAWWRGLTVLKPGDIEMIRAMAGSLAEEPLVQQGILNGLIEHSFIWQDPETGIWLKWRPDAIPTDSLNFSDLKTTTAVDDETIDRTIGKYGYNMQGALGALACHAIIGREMDDFSLVLVEKEEAMPCVRVKTLKPGDIDLGLSQIAVALKTFAKCIETGEWLGPGGRQHDAEFAGLTKWDYERIDYRIKEMERQLA